MSSIIYIIPKRVDFAPKLSVFSKSYVFVKTL